MKEKDDILEETKRENKQLKNEVYNLVYYVYDASFFTHLSMLQLIGNEVQLRSEQEGKDTLIMRYREQCEQLINSNEILAKEVNKLKECKWLLYLSI